MKKIFGKWKKKHEGSTETRSDHGANCSEFFNSDQVSGPSHEAVRLENSTSTATTSSNNVPVADHIASELSYACQTSHSFRSIVDEDVNEVLSAVRPTSCTSLMAEEKGLALSSSHIPPRNTDLLDAIMDCGSFSDGDSEDDSSPSDTEDGTAEAPRKTIEAPETDAVSYAPAPLRARTESHRQQPKEDFQTIGTANSNVSLPPTNHQDSVLETEDSDLDSSCETEDVVEDESDEESTKVRKVVINLSMLKANGPPGYNDKNPIRHDDSARDQNFTNNVQRQTPTGRSINWEQVISRAGIRTVSQLQFTVPNLVSLNISHNQLVNLEGLPHTLRYLNVSNNEIEKMGDCLAKLSDLQFLDISNNQLTSIGVLPKSLRELYLGGNKIASIENLDTLRDLEVVDFENNCISAMHQVRALSHNTNLRSIILQGNPLSSNPGLKGFLKNLLPNLDQLDHQPLRVSTRPKSTSRSSHTPTPTPTHHSTQASTRKKPSLPHTSLSQPSQPVAPQTVKIYSAIHSQEKPAPRMKSPLQAAQNPVKSTANGRRAVTPNSTVSTSYLEQHHRHPYMTPVRMLDLVKRGSGASKSIPAAAGQDAVVQQPATTSSASHPPSATQVQLLRRPAHDSYEHRKPRAPSRSEYGGPQRPSAGKVMVSHKRSASVERPRLEQVPSSKQYNVPIKSRRQLEATPTRSRVTRIPGGPYRLGGSTTHGANVISAPVHLDHDNGISNLNVELFSLMQQHSDADISKMKGIKQILKGLNEKINKLYNWHMVELELVSKQQMQLKHMTDDLESTKNALKSVINTNTLSLANTNLTSPAAPATNADANISAFIHNGGAASVSSATDYGTAQAEGTLGSDHTKIEEELVGAYEELKITRKALSTAIAVAEKQQLGQAHSNELQELKDLLVKSGLLSGAESFLVPSLHPLSRSSPLEDHSHENKGPNECEQQAPEEGAHGVLIGHQQAIAPSKASDIERSASSDAQQSLVSGFGNEPRCTEDAGELAISDHCNTPIDSSCDDDIMPADGDDDDDQESLLDIETIAGYVDMFNEDLSTTYLALKTLIEHIEQDDFQLSVIIDYKMLFSQANLFTPCQVPTDDLFHKMFSQLDRSGSNALGDLGTRCGTLGKLGDNGQHHTAQEKLAMARKLVQVIQMCNEAKYNLVELYAVIEKERRPSRVVLDFVRHVKESDSYKNFESLQQFFSEHGGGNLAVADLL